MSGPHVAILAPLFPPMGGGGVVRVRAMTKYLARRGLQITVWTRTTQPQKYTVRDYRGLKGFTVHYLPNPGWTESLPWQLHGGFPDNLCYWSVKLAWEARADRADVIYSTGPPHSIHLAGLLLREYWRVPWIMEYRDTWVSNFSYPRSGWLRKIDRVLEKVCTARADRMVGVTPAGVGSLSWQFGPRARYIPNGFDPENYAGIPDVRSLEPLAVFAGGMDRLRDPEPLAQAITELEIPIKLLILGPVDREIGPCFRALLKTGQAEIRGALPHQQTLEQMAQAHVLIHLGEVADLWGESVAGKLYEYIAVGRPILSLVNPGDASRLLRAIPNSRCARPDDVKAIGKALKELLTRSSKTTPVPDEIIARHAYPQLAQRLHLLIQELLSEGAIHDKGF